MLSKEYLKQLYEAGYENLALSLAVVLYCKEKSSKFYKKNKKLIKRAISIISAYAIFRTSFLCYITADERERIEYEKLENEKIYSAQIEEYNKNNIAYANDIKALNLSDLETILLIMNDMKNNYTAGIDNNVISGYWRLEFNEFGQGDCKCYADDFVAKINEINPEYNARSIAVYCINSEQEYEVLLEDFLLDNSTAINGKRFGNHAVVALDIKEGNYTLVVDPTFNIIVGILKCGKIFRFEHEIVYDYKMITGAAYTQEDYETMVKNIKNTFRLDDITWWELMKIYGDEAVEDALNSAVRKRELYKSNN